MASEVVQFVGKGTSVRDVLGDVLNRADEWETVIVLTLTEDRDLGIAHSDGSLLEKVGMSALAVDYFSDIMRS